MLPDLLPGRNVCFLLITRYSWEQLRVQTRDEVLFSLTLQHLKVELASSCFSSSSTSSSFSFSFSFSFFCCCSSSSSWS